MNYQKHLKKGFIFIFKNILQEIAESGIISKGGLTIEFSTTSKSVVVSDRVRSPDKMVIVLADRSFDDLRVFDLFFEVILYFDEQEELFKIPYICIERVSDVENSFELDFASLGNENDFYLTEENIINIDFESLNNK